MNPPSCRLACWDDGHGTVCPVRNGRIGRVLPRACLGARHFILFRDWIALDPHEEVQRRAGVASRHDVPLARRNAITVAPTGKGLATTTITTYGRAKEIGSTGYPSDILATWCADTDGKVDDRAYKVGFEIRA